MTKLIRLCSSSIVDLLIRMKKFYIIVHFTPALLVIHEHSFSVFISASNDEMYERVTTWCLAAAAVLYWNWNWKFSSSNTVFMSFFFTVICAAVWKLRKFVSDEEWRDGKWYTTHSRARERRDIIVRDALMMIVWNLPLHSSPSPQQMNGWKNVKCEWLVIFARAHDWWIM